MLGLSRRSKILSAIGLISIYVSIWFYSAHHLKEFIISLKDNKSFSFSCEKVKISGFPFNLVANLDNVKLDYEIKNDFVNSSLALSTNHLSIKTNMLFNSLKITIPDKTSSIIKGKDNEYKLDFISQQGNYITLKEKNFINSFRILKADISNDLSIDKIHHKLQEFLIVNQENQSKLMIINSSSAFSKKDKAKNHAEFNNKSTTNIEILDHDYFKDIFFHKLTNILDVLIDIKSPEHRATTFKGDIKNIQFDLDEAKLKLHGKIEKNNQGETNIDLILNIDKWRKLIDNLHQQKTLSYERHVILMNLMKVILGPEDILKEQAEIKIYNTKEGSLNLGKTDLNGLSPYIQQFFSNK